MQDFGLHHKTEIFLGMEFEVSSWLLNNCFPFLLNSELQIENHNCATITLYLASCVLTVQELWDRRSGKKLKTLEI